MNSMSPKCSPTSEKSSSSLQSGVAEGVEMSPSDLFVGLVFETTKLNISSTVIDLFLPGTLSIFSE